MANPFDDLPALTRAPPPPPPPPAPPAQPKKREREESEQEEEERQAPKAPPPAAPPPPPAKQPRREEDDDDDVLAALARLTPHLRSAARVVKAGPLLCQLLDGGGRCGAPPRLDPLRHAPAAFDAIAAAFADPSLFLSSPPQTRIEYARIARSAQKAAAATLGWEEGGGGGGGGGGGSGGNAAASASAFVSECVGAWALLRLELLSAEDGFALSRALGKLKALVDALPGWQEGDEVEEEAEDGEGEAATATATASTAKSKATAAAAAPLCWPPSAAAVLLLRRRAALDCALCARDHVLGGAKAWAATAVEMALDHVAAAAAAGEDDDGGGRSKFAPGKQRREALALRSFVSAQRAARRAGGGRGGAGAAAGAKDDRGAFERAQAQFASAGNVSARGSVGRGAGGSTPWLG